MAGQTTFEFRSTCGQTMKVSCCNDCPFLSLAKGQYFCQPNRGWSIDFPVGMDVGTYGFYGIDYIMKIPLGGKEVDLSIVQGDCLVAQLYDSGKNISEGELQKINKHGES